MTMLVAHATFTMLNISTTPKGFSFIHLRYKDVVGMILKTIYYGNQPLGVYSIDKN